MQTPVLSIPNVPFFLPSLDCTQIALALFVLTIGFVFFGVVQVCTKPLKKTQNEKYCFAVEKNTIDFFFRSRVPTFFLERQKNWNGETKLERLVRILGTSSATPSI